MVTLVPKEQRDQKPDYVEHTNKGMNTSNTSRSHTYQPSISAIVTGERVRKYWYILAILNHSSMNSVPLSDDQLHQYSCSLWGYGHRVDLTNTTIWVRRVRVLCTKRVNVKWTRDRGWGRGIDEIRNNGSVMFHNFVSTCCKIEFLQLL